MGIYGAGKAFNLRYAQNTYVPNRGMNIRQARQPIMFGGHCHCAPQNTNVTINNGPTGFWGFMSGLFGGLFGGGGMMGMGMGGGLFGGNGNNGCEWLIWILLLSCFCGSGNGLFGGNGNGCGCGCGCGCN